MTDGQGRVVDFKNTIIIMTSNMGAGAIAQTLIERGHSQNDVANAKQMVLQKLKEKVAPEFINRIDEIVMFLPLGKEEIEKIVRLQVARMCIKLKKNGLDIEFDNRAIDFLAEKGFVPEYGARPVKRTINDLFVNELTLKVLNKELNRDQKIQVTTSGETLVFNNI